jgi:hypothetical protein
MREEKGLPVRYTGEIRERLARIDEVPVSGGSPEDQPCIPPPRGRTSALTVSSAIQQIKQNVFYRIWSFLWFLTTCR